MADKDVVVKAPIGAMSTFSDKRPDWMGDDRRGSENVTIQDMTIPRLSIVQSLSPQRLKNNPEYIKGAEEGMIFNTVTRKLYNPPITVVPVFFRKEVVLWKKRIAGGGFKGAFKMMEEAQAMIETMPDKIIMVNQTKDNPQGVPTEAYEALDTAHQFVLVVEDDGSVNPASMSLVKTGLTFSRKFNSLIELSGGDRFSKAYSVRTEFTKGAKGDFYAWKVDPKGFVSEALYAEAAKLYKAVSSGEKNVAYENEHPDD